jgi:hypothetical protein
MNLFRLPLAIAALAAALTAQNITPFPSEYVNVPEGPYNSPNFPLAYGNSRVLILYQESDLAIPHGAQILRLGFRQDDTITTLDQGRTLQLEIRMGYSANAHTGMVTNFDNNYVAPPTTVFGPAALVLPNLRDATNPLPNGQLFLTLTTPFVYQPQGNNLVVEYRVFGNSGGGTAWNYRLDRADYYSPVVIGPAGCPHSGSQVPALTVEPTRPGLNYTSNLTRGPGASFAVLLLATHTQLLPPYSLQALVPGIDPGCLGQVPLTNPTLLTGFTSSSGNAAWSFPIPNNVALFGHVEVTSQAVMLDFFAPGGMVVSNGVQVRTGIRPRTTILYASGQPGSLTTGSLNVYYCPVALFDYL